MIVLEITLSASDVETLDVECWGMLSTTSLPLLPGPLRPGVIVPLRVQSMGQIKLFKHLLYLKPYNFNKWLLNWIISII